MENKPLTQVKVNGLSKGWCLDREFAFALVDYEREHGNEACATDHNLKVIY